MAQKQEKFLPYAVCDYLLIDENNQIQAVAGNSDFWDSDSYGSSREPVTELHESEAYYTIVQVVRVNKPSYPRKEKEGELHD